jgi:hypothetical protein
VPPAQIARRLERRPMTLFEANAAKADVAYHAG